MGVLGLTRCDSKNIAGGQALAKWLIPKGGANPYLLGMLLPTARQVLRELLPPPKGPLAEKTIWSVSLLLLLAVLLLDIATPSSLAVGTVLCASVAFAALGASRRMIWQLTALCVLANLIAGFWNGWRDGLEPDHLANRAVSILTVILVGFLTTRARIASERAAQLLEEEKQLTRERVLRQLAEEMGGPLGQAEFVARAAQALQHVTAASSVEIGAMNRTVLAEPHALWLAPDLTPRDHPSQLGQRLPVEVLARPAGAGNTWQSGELFLGRLRRPTAGDLLVMLRSPRTSPHLTCEAIETLEPLLERTALLDDLREQRSQLAQRGEILRDLVYAFSHDLRTPLLANSINMNAALKGAYGPLPSDYQATLRNGLEANQTLLSLADQLLLVAKFESGEVDDEAQAVLLREVVLSVWHDLEAKASQKGIIWQPELAGVTVYGRRHELRRAIQNLLENAVKFSPYGGVLEARLHQEHDQAVLQVLDSGAGISAERQAALFQRFGGHGAGSGSGLGLYLTRRIAEAHGGSVRYSRNQRAQSVFTLSLPVEAA